MEKLLQKKEVKLFTKRLNENYGFSGELPYLFYKDGDEIYIAAKKLKNINEAKHLGLLFSKDLVLSIEGSQIIGPSSKKNVLEINEEEKLRWLSGEDLNLKAKGIVILKNGKDYLGCGVAKEDKVINSLEKKRLIDGKKSRDSS